MEKVQLGTLVKITSGFAFKSNLFNTDKKGLPLIRIRDVVRGYSDTYYDGEYKAEYLIQKGDALIGMDGEFNLALWNSGKALLNQRVCKIQSIDERLDQNYLIRFLPKALKDIEDRTPFVTVKHLSVKDINNIQIPLPPLAEQRRIASILDQADELRQKRQQAIEKLDQLLQATFIEMFGDPVSNPKGWEKVKFEDEVEFLTGFAFKSADFKDSGIKLCRGINILPNTLDWNDTAYWNEKELEKYSRFKILQNDILVAMDRPWISTGFKITLVKENDPNMLLVQRVARLRVKESFGANFLFQILSMPEFKKHCRITETTVPHISPTDFKSFDLIKPANHMIEKFEKIAKLINIQKDKMRDSEMQNDNLFASLQNRAFNGTL
ncbi:restriction endonuclease subunit S [Acinetobacter baumannii]|uniref:restriction endonuclease subunit S n=1 Tax=Acinetobacter baumannii TaxID=470 RepID=UPI00244A5523|nr:restriction endonuclease subunit S [Acinetobacter baumannii]MDH2465123.1 restriction endonuclease subunit S [Acinetobacter baumannii]